MGEDFNSTMHIRSSITFHANLQIRYSISCSRMRSLKWDGMRWHISGIPLAGYPVKMTRSIISYWWRMLGNREHYPLVLLLSTSSSEEMFLCSSPPQILLVGQTFDWTFRGARCRAGEPLGVQSGLFRVVHPCLVEVKRTFAFTIWTLSGIQNSSVSAV